jgi:putative addiction module component (TIGR02574 family)
MSATEILVQIRQLPLEEQRELFERLRDEFDDEALSAEQIAELDRRAEEALKHPERCRPLEDVVADIERRFRTG